MHQLHISALNPELPALECTQFKAAVTLIWPYSSSARQFALLLAEPDFRLRRKKGQVRALFSGSSAKALATTGIGIGDEVILSLRGAKFVQGETASTPGKSIDWELSYSQTVVARVFRNGNETANLELLDVAPTPAPRSPVRPEPARQWSSPAFLKRVRLSDGPFFEAPYDPLADENVKGHSRKRQRKSYGDWKAWTYSARTPSPEKEGAGLEDGSEVVEVSPSRPAQLPHTPVSPTEPEAPSVAVDLLDHLKHDTTGPGSKRSNASLVHNTDYHELYAGSNEFSAADPQYAFGGDTEVDTELNTEDEDAAQDEPDIISVGTTEADSEGHEDDEQHPIEQEASDVDSSVHEENVLEDVTISDTEEDSSIEISQEHLSESVTNEVERKGTDWHQSNFETRQPVGMLPPSLPSLQTNFPAMTAPSLLTPIGREPTSPTLQPQDSSTLPLPSPFPGERATDDTSTFLDRITARDQPLDVEPEVIGEEPPSDASYILETSFFSSITSSKASAIHPNHETAFTPVRFTFGFDGAGSSRPMELSSPEPPEHLADDSNATHDHIEILGTARIDASLKPEPEFPTAANHEKSGSIADVYQSEQLFTARLEDSSETEVNPKVVESLSDSEEEEPQVVRLESQNYESITAESDPNRDEPNEESATRPDTLQSVAQSDFADLDLLMEDSKDEEQPITETHPNDSDRTRMEDDEQTTSEKSKSLVVDPQQSFNVQNIDLGQQVHFASHEELINIEFAPKDPNTAMSMEKRVHTHVQISQEPHSTTEDLEQESFLNIDEHDSQLLVGDLGVSLHNIPSQGESLLVSAQQSDLAAHHPDVEMESVREASLSQIHQPTEEAVPDSPSTPLAAHPDEHDKPDLFSVPESAISMPGDTRFNDNITISADREELTVPKRTTRSTRSKGSVTSIASTIISPPRTTHRSITSPSQDPAQSSPYRLRSRSKPLSPAQEIQRQTTPRRKRSHKHVASGSLDSTSDLELLRTPSKSMFEIEHEMLQEHDASANPKTTSLPSEHSTSIDQHPDHLNVGVTHTDTTTIDLTKRTTQRYNTMNTTPPPTLESETVNETGTGPWEKVVDSSASKQERAIDTTLPNYLDTDPTAEKRISSKATTEFKTPSPRNLRKTRRRAHGLSPESQGPIEKPSVRKTSRALQENLNTPDHKEPSERISGQTQASPSVPQSEIDVIGLTPHSPLHTAPGFLVEKQPSAVDRNSLITPEATQQTTLDSQPDFHFEQQHQNLPMTPQLTQTTSTGLGSFQVGLDNEQHAVASPVISSPITKSTPRPNVTANDIESAPTSQHSPDVSSSEALQSELPALGLSTKMAYYTPLKDLACFLNRSSQLYSSANPDVLALVTSSTTPFQRAKKGPKHWNTTLHITDLSTWPSTTTVNVFRPYQTALPQADVGDVVLLRSFGVKSLNRHPTLISTEESGWCVWRYGKPVWGVQKGIFSEIQAREESTGPVVEKGEGEWREVGRLRGWYVSKIKDELQEKEESQVKTRSKNRKSKASAEAGL